MRCRLFRFELVLCFLTSFVADQDLHSCFIVLVLVDSDLHDVIHQAACLNGGCFLSAGRAGSILIGCLSFLLILRIEATSLAHAGELEPHTLAE